MESTHLVEVFRSLANKRRLEIVLLCKKPHTVTQISRKLKIPLTRTSEYLGTLQKNGLIEKSRNKDNTVSIISLININTKGEIKKVTNY